MLIESIDALAHPSLDARAFTTEFPRPLGQLADSAALHSLLRLDAEAPFRSTDRVRAVVRDLLRHGGFKPTGRSKPASEYLVRAAEEQRLAPINWAVDACNVVSLHSGLPISVVDVDRVEGPLRIQVAAAGESYVFNPSGQVLDLSGLLCLYDAQGPCANAVKDSQRTKTSADTVRTLSIVWGTRELFGLAAATTRWYGELLQTCSAQVQPVPIVVSASSE